MDKHWNRNRFCAKAQESEDGFTEIAAACETEANAKLPLAWCALVILDFLFGGLGLFVGFFGYFTIFSFLLIVYFMSVVMYNIVKIANAVSNKNNA